MLSEVLRDAGAQSALAEWVKDRSGTGVSAVLLVVHGVTPFAESLTGFGIGITIGIPLLSNFGLSPKKVAVIGLLGLCTIPWGSMGPGTMVAASMSELSFKELGVASGYASLLPLITTGAIAAWLVSVPGARLTSVLLGTLSGIALASLITTFNYIVGTSAAGALGSLVIIILHFLKMPSVTTKSLSPIARRALCSYAVLLLGVLLSDWLTQLQIFSNSWRFMASPAPWLFIAAIFFTNGLPQSRTLSRVWGSWLQVAPVTALFIVLGMLMTVSGMAAYLALAIATTGRVYVLIAPFIGAIGGLITGSNVGANAMFAATQAATARTLDINVLWFMAIHNVAAAFLMMASPGKIEMAIQLIGAEATAHRQWIQRVLMGVALSVVAGLALINVLLTLKWF
jgi:lactate permease